MRVLIAAAAFSSEMSGLQRHAFNVVQCLLQRPEVTAVHLVVAPWQRQLAETASRGSDGRLSTHMADMRQTSIGRNCWYYLRLPEIAAALNIDLVHLSYPMPINSQAFSCPIMVTLHDLYPYEIPLNFGFPKFIFNRLVLQQCLKQVDAIACVSDTTLHRLKQYGPASAQDRAVRIYNCVEPMRPDNSPRAIPGWQGEPFLLCVAQHRRNKNIALLIRSFARLLRLGQIDHTTRLFVVGINGPETPRINRLVSRYALDERVQFFAGLSESQLQWCYANCRALIAPSVTEGFGLPVIEAQLAGCSVVCADIPAHREVGGEHCTFVSLCENPEAELADSIAETLQRPRTKPVSFPQFSAGVLAEQYVTLYQTLINALPLRRRSRFSVSSCAPTSERQVL